MLDSASKAFFHILAKSGLLKKLASQYGMRRPTSFARRFIAGETVGEAIEAARAVQARGILPTFDLLGESVSSLEDADAADAPPPVGHRRDRRSRASTATSRSS